MSSRQSSSEGARCFFALLAVFVILLPFPVPGRASADDRHDRNRFSTALR